jgi:hypothetical protein
MKKTRKDIQAEVEATLNLVSEIAPVEPAAELKGWILHRMVYHAPKVIPLYRRPVFAAAAALVVLALNVITVVWLLRQDAPSQSSGLATDRIADIQSAYSLDQSIY